MKKSIATLLIVMNWTCVNAQELVVLECNFEDGKWAGNVEIDLKNKKLKYENIIDKFATEQWNKFLKEYSEKENKPYVPKKNEAKQYEITKITSSEIQATQTGIVIERGEILINRYTLTLKEKYGEYKCQKKQKEF
jgi:hypothetical protein